MFQWPQRAPRTFFLVMGVVWVALYWALQPLSIYLVNQFPLNPDSHLRAALQFFIYDAPKVLLLLTGVVFVMGIVNTWFTPERTRALLSSKNEGVGNILAAMLGVVTPFCSCSAVPLFIGFVRAGVPLGVTFSFLIAAPMVNEIALALLFALFGIKIALLYLALGLAIAIVSGWIIGRLGLQNHLEDWVLAMSVDQVEYTGQLMSLADRMQSGFSSVREVVGKVWIYVLIGIFIGALIHGYVPEEFMAGIMGQQAWWSVPISVLIGIPMYTNAAGIIPVVEALLAKGAALGTVLAFMMSVIALSLPEIVILRKVLKPRLIAVFVSVVAVGILIVGYVFNILI